MTKRPVTFSSNRWTGEMPRATPKPPSTASLLLGIVLVGYGVIYAPWAIYSGVSKGLIRVPLARSHRWISINDESNFTLCVVGWILFFIVSCWLGILFARLLRNKLER